MFNVIWHGHLADNPIHVSIFICTATQVTVLFMYLQLFHTVILIVGSPIYMFIVTYILYHPLVDSPIHVLCLQLFGTII